MYGLNPHL